MMSSNRISKHSILAVFIMSTIATYSSTASEIVPLRDQWLFSSNATAPKADSSDWEKVNIPHTWNAIDAANGGGVDDQSRDGYHRGPAWYRREFQAGKDFQGKRAFLRFQGVSSVADVFINGVHLDQHQGAFTAFTREVTKNIKPGERNELLVRADNTWREDVLPLSGDFPVFGGIYRPVDIVLKPTLCISPLDHGAPGMRVRQSDVGKDSAKVAVTVLLDNAGEKTAADLKFSIRDAQGTVVATETVPIVVEGKAEETRNFTIKNPRLWDGIEDPHLYKVEVALLHQGNVIDSEIQPLGLRSIRIDPEKGFFLNGRPYALHGVSRHQDRAGKGWAVTPEDEEEDIAIIREIGAKCVRTAHYPASQNFLDLCDREGFLVWVELPLVDCISEHPALPGNARSQLVEMIRQYQNHPSIFCWGISNELYHRKSPDATDFIADLAKVAREEDPTRPTVCAVNKALDSLCKSTDVFALNTYPGWYSGEFSDIKKLLKKFNALGGDRGIAVSEYGAGASIHHQEQNPAKPDAGGYWHPEQWQSLFHESTYRSILETPYCWASFVWNLFDFASVWRNEGDTPGINDKGLATYDRKTKKDAFYFYKANWSKEPVLYITSQRHTARTEALTPVKVYSNAKSVTLKINNKTVGAKEVDSLGIAVWPEVRLEEGENHIVVEAERDGQNLSDSCAWILNTKSAR